MNPLIFIPKKFLSSRLTKEELQSVSEVLEKYDDCIFFLRVASRLKLIDMDQQLNNIKNYLTPEEKKVAESFRKPHFDEIQEVFHGTLAVSASHLFPSVLIASNLRKITSTPCLSSCRRSQQISSTPTNTVKESSLPCTIRFDFPLLNHIQMPTCSSRL